jgi:8-oxo-dGTP diphosphatase
MIEPKFFLVDSKCDGAKGLIYIGSRILVYKRDDKTNVYPRYIDLPGGGTDKGETPFETLKREVKEEFGLSFSKKDIVYAKRFDSSFKPGKTAYFAVIKLQDNEETNVVFGDEGESWELIDLDDYIRLPNVAWPILQERAEEYLNSII